MASKELIKRIQCIQTKSLNEIDKNHNDLKVLDIGKLIRLEHA